ncbi:uncharacterized protein PAC_00239 [Phialocephala subalpina]|uniref:DUF7791 domain-containing protein n=1 Tax=Phialocephala subalpina TaxID=576137 RepID=A0A1L7WC50_9HELO|nr:uncharacterized protein PAC_00239 [Phialocephala subalpina]
MLDPVTALGVASNVVQLVTFTSDLISKSREFYESADGALVEQLELEAITVSLQSLSSDLILPTIRKEDQLKVTPTEKQLREICNGCRDVSKELLVLIRDVRAEGPHKKWNSFQQALKFVLRSKKDVKQWQRNLVDEVHRGDWKIQNDKDLVNFSAKLSACAKEEGDLLMKQHILERLHFGEIEDRAERIPEAHGRTFEWIFQPLEVSDGTLGPGELNTGSQTSTAHSSDEPEKQAEWSGKSTLMKYLQRDKRTLDYLKPWINGRSIITAGFFFWNSGTAMQMSKLGLLQTLLYGAIEENLDLISVISRRRWKSYLLFGGDVRNWSMTELVEAFQFDGDGAEIVKFIQDSISSRENIKFCAASRPWLVFEDAFQRQPSLRVEDLTVADIQLFVTEKLHESQIFVTLSNLDHPASTALISEVTTKASGVFLWVQLVVLSLLEGLRDGDAITDLQARLLVLPADLEYLFEKMLGDLNPAYFEQASMYFQIVRAATDPLPIILLSFAEEGLEKAIEYKMQPETNEQQRFRAEIMRRRLSSRCKGLLEAPRAGVELPQAKVQFLHRTARDFIHKPKVWGYVASGTNDSFDANIRLSASWLFELKTMAPRSYPAEHVWSSIRSCVEYSLKFENTKPDLHILLLDEPSQVGDTLFDTSGPNGSTWHQDIIAHESQIQHLKLGRITHWTCTENLKPGLERGTTSFFEYAFIYPLRTYVINKLQNGAPLDVLILNHSLLYTAASAKNFEFLELLFSLGADPNAGESAGMGWTTWEYVSRRIVFDKESLNTSEEVVKIVQLFLDNGADLQANLGDLSVHELIKKRCHNGTAAIPYILLSKVFAAAETAKSPRKKEGRKRTKSPFAMLPILERPAPTRKVELMGSSSAEDAENVEKFGKPTGPLNTAPKEPLQQPPKHVKSKFGGILKFFRRSKGRG